MRRALALCIVAGLGCGLPASVKTPETARPLVVHAVDWNPRHENVGTVDDVEDVGSDLVAFAHDGSASVIVDGVVVNVDRSGLRSGGVVPAPDGSGLWIVGIDPKGGVRRLRARKSFEPVSSRYGLDGRAVDRIAGFGGRYVAFETRGELALADGVDVTRYPSGALGLLAAGGARLAALTSEGLFSFDALTRTSQRFPLDDARYVAVDEAGHVYAATNRAVYAQTNDGHLALRYVARADVHGLVVSHERVWFVEGDELGMIDATDVWRTHGAHVSSSAHLDGSPSGDVWAVGEGHVARYAVGNAGAASARWQDVVAPIFSHACASCHGPDGQAGIDLSTEAAWRTKKDVLRQRVTIDRDMPPSGHTLDAPDRDAIRAWLQR